MTEHESTTETFEHTRPHLRAVAYRMLGSISEAEDAVQEAWLKLNRTDASGIESLRAWLTTVVARVCLDMLRSRKSRHEETIDAHVPDPIISRDDGSNPETELLLADSVGLALIVVLETLAPAERLAFVLHDMFGMPFDEIAPIVGSTLAATRQLASRARRRVQGGAPVPDVDLPRQREVVDAFMAASRKGDFAALLAVLDPDVVLRGDRGPGTPMTRVVRGAEAVMKGVLAGAKFASEKRVEQPAVVNGAAGVVVFVDGKPFSVIGFTVVRGKIVEINVLADPERLAKLDVSVLID